MQVGFREVLALAIIAVFAALRIMSQISEDGLLTVVMAIVGYYFGSYTSIRKASNAMRSLPIGVPTEILGMTSDNLRRFASILIGAGVALIFEHYVTYGYVLDNLPWDHSFYGLIMLIVGMLILRKGGG